MSYQSQDSEGWCYSRVVELIGDQRALVSMLDEHGMEWVGIRVWNSQRGVWYNGNEPERVRVYAWQPLKQTARRHYSCGILIEEYKP